jgi:hypothetical protein
MKERLSVAAEQAIRNLNAQMEEIMIEGMEEIRRLHKASSHNLRERLEEHPENMKEEFCHQASDKEKKRAREDYV